MTWTASFYYAFFVFSLICCKYIVVASTSSTTYLFTKLQKTFSSCEPRKELLHAGLYSYNGRQIIFFHIIWFICG